MKPAAHILVLEQRRSRAIINLVMILKFPRKRERFLSDWQLTHVRIDEHGRVLLEHYYIMLVKRTCLNTDSEQKKPLIMIYVDGTLCMHWGLERKNERKGALRPFMPHLISPTQTSSKHCGLATFECFVIYVRRTVGMGNYVSFFPNLRKILHSTFMRR